MNPRPYGINNLSACEADSVSFDSTAELPALNFYRKYSHNCLSNNSKLKEGKYKVNWSGHRIVWSNTLACQVNNSGSNPGDRIYVLISLVSQLIPLHVKTLHFFLVP